MQVGQIIRRLKSALRNSHKILVNHPENSKRMLNIHIKRVQVSVVDSKDGDLGKVKFIQLNRIIDLNKTIQIQFRSKAEQVTKQGTVKDGGN